MWHIVTLYVTYSQPLLLVHDRRLGDLPDIYIYIYIYICMYMYIYIYIYTHTWCTHPQRAVAATAQRSLATGRRQGTVQGTRYSERNLAWEGCWAAGEVVGMMVAVYVCVCVCMYVCMYVNDAHIWNLVATNMNVYIPIHTYRHKRMHTGTYLTSKYLWVCEH